MLNQYQKSTILIIILFFAIFIPLKFSQAQIDPNSLGDSSLSDLQNQIQEKANQINEIQNKITAYEKQVDSLQSQAATLKGRINLLDNQINQSEDEVNLISTEIQTKELEIKKINLDIQKTQAEIKQKLTEIEAIIKEINSLDEDYLTPQEAESRGIIDVFINFFKIIVKYSSWSDYEKTIEDTNTINELLKEKKDTLANLESDLEQNRQEAENKAAELTDKSNQLQNKQQVLAAEKNSKKDILDQTQSNEQKYEQLLEKAGESQKALNQEVVVLKDEVRKKIASLQEGTVNLNAILSWPIPYRRITTTFHDPSYPFRRYFEHNAIDIACPQGTPIYAPAAGYVASARDAGYGYNYISLIHTEKLQTRYGHVSRFAVQAGDFVKSGQIIGYSGGMPGSPGAGYFTTGPHLHFEVHTNTGETNTLGATTTHWEAVNPLNYLP